MKKQIGYLKIRAILFLAFLFTFHTRLPAREITKAAVLTSRSDMPGRIATPKRYSLSCRVFLDSTNAPEINTMAEHIFSGVKGRTSETRSIIISNTGAVALQVSSLVISGTHAAAFGFVNPPATPFTIPVGSSRTVGLVFKPSSTTVGALNAIFTIANNDPDEGTLKVSLYGLSANGEQGNNEPPFDAIVKTLGYNVNVGGTGLILSTTPNAIGDEVLTPLFKKAGPGNVTMKPVARYSPDDILDYGYYTKPNGTPVVKKIGQVALDQEQKLNPAMVSGSATSFDPGGTVFGFYTGATSYANQPTFTEDAFNTGPLAHSARIYPLKNRAGQLIPNSYLVAFEPASNGDYQDYVFTVSNVMPSTSNPSGSSIRINTGGSATTVGNVQWSGCIALGACTNYVTGGFSYAQASPPAITGFTAPLSQAIFQSEWTGGSTGANAVPAGQVAFKYIIPVVNGSYTVRLHFAELNKNGAGLRIFDVNIEGGAKELVNFDIFAQAGGIRKAIFRDFPVSVTDGNVTIDFIRQVENAKISAIEILPSTNNSSQLYEAEKAEIFRAVVKATNSGFSGTGYVDYINSTLDYIQWTLPNASGGATSLQFRHASGTANRALKLVINGATVVQSLNFPATGGWANWSVVSLVVTLQPGTNTIKLEANGSSVPNIDYVLVSPSSNVRMSLEEKALDSKAKLEAVLSPNPCFGETQVNIKTVSDLAITVEVKDLLGKTHQLHQTRERALVLKGLQKGVYIIQVNQGGKVASRRLVVQ